MNKILRIGLISLVVLAVLGVAYYFLIYMPSPKEPPAEGSACSTTGGIINDGNIVLGKCLKIAAAPSGELQPR